jgi:protein phosphatase
VLSQVPDPTAAVIELVDLALAAGAPDNVTAVIADVIEVDDDAGDLESALGQPVVVGAAGDRRNRAALPGLLFPDDVGPGDGVDPSSSSGGPAVAGGLAARSQSRARTGVDDDDQDEDPQAPGATAEPDSQDPAGAAAPAGSIGAAVESGELAVGGPARAAAVAETEAQQEGPGWLRRHWRGLLAASAVAGVLLVGALGFLWWLSSQWFVGPSGPYVAIYQGIPQEVAGVPLNRVVTSTALPVATLPYYDQAQLQGTLDAGTRVQAQRIVTDLEAKSAACSSQQAPLGCPTPPTDGGAGTDSPGATPGPTPTASPVLR